MDDNLELAQDNLVSIGEEGQSISFKPSTNALEFLKSITESELRLCLFEEKLVRCSDDQKSVGEFVIQVDKVTRAGEELIFIHASSQGKVDGYPEGFTTSCYVRNDLTIIEQIHNEFVKIPQHEYEKRVHMQRQDDGSLAVDKQVVKGMDIKKKEYLFTSEESVGLVTEGSNLLLQRLLAKRRVDEEMVFLAIDVEAGALMPSIYKPLPERTQTIGSQTIEVVGIERVIESSNELPQSWQSHFMDDGHLTMRVQVGASTIVTVERVPHRIEPELIEARPVFGKKKLNWEEDAELYSKFLQRKSELKADHQTYIRNHADMRALLADFFQYVLLHKPDDAVSFASEYFASFSSAAPDPPSHKQSTTNI